MAHDIYLLVLITGVESIKTQMKDYVYRPFSWLEVEASS